MGRKKSLLLPDRDALYEDYCVRKLSLPKLCRKYKTGQSSINSLLDTYAIPRNKPGVTLASKRNKYPFLTEVYLVKRYVREEASSCHKGGDVHSVGMFYIFVVAGI